MASAPTHRQPLPAPLWAIRIAQVLMLAVLALIASVLSACQGLLASLVLTWIGIAFFIISLSTLWYIPKPLIASNPAEFSTLQPLAPSSFTMGLRYLSGMLLYASYYLIMSEAAWNMHLADQTLIATGIALFAIYSFITDFPTTPV